MNTIVWTHAGPSVVAAFLALPMEFVEALLVILAVGAVRGWRDTLLGAAAALGALLNAVATFSSALARNPLGIFQLVVGVLLLLLLFAWAFLPRLARNMDWNGAILFAGLAVILVESTVRHAGPPK